MLLAGILSYHHRSNYNNGASHQVFRVVRSQGHLCFGATVAHLISGHS